MIDNALTQNEIDSLLAQAMGTGEETAVPEKFLSIRPYDFRRPSKLSKDQIRTLQLIFGNFARLSSTVLSGALHTQVHMAVVSIQQAVFDEYTRGLPPVTTLHLSTVDPLPGTFVFEIDMNTAFLMLDLLLGGVGTAEQPDHELTDIEEILLRSISNMILSAFADCWAHIVQITPRLQRVEYSLPLRADRTGDGAGGALAVRPAHSQPANHALHVRSVLGAGADRHGAEHANAVRRAAARWD